MKLSYIPLLLSLSFGALADSITVTFDPPIMREDGTSVTLSEIGGFNVFLDRILVPSSKIIPPGTSKYSLQSTETSFTIDVAPGTHVINMTAVDTDGRESVFSKDVIVKAKSPLNSPTVSVTVIVNVK